MATKDKVLKELTDNAGRSVSGEHLAELCQVSRAAIWKAVNTLRQDGLDIQGTTNGGYILNSPVNLFSQDLFFSYIQENLPHLSNNLIQCFKQIDSTNTYAKKLIFML